MGNFATGKKMTLAATAATALIMLLNVVLLKETFF